MSRRRRVLKWTGISLAGLLLLVGSTFWYSRAWDRGFILEPMYALPTEERVVALTFDDGPSEGRTPKLLELLERHEVKATFFMVGEKIEAHPEIAKEVYEAGHLIGNHSYDHARLVFRTPGFVREQVERTDALILGLGQSDVRYFRPPYSSKYLVLPWVLSDMDKVLVTGTFDPPAEYETPYPAERVADEVVAHVRARSGSGAIVYLHDGKDADVDAFIESVDRIITELKAEGYRFVRLDTSEAQKTSSAMRR